MHYRFDSDLMDEFFDDVMTNLYEEEGDEFDPPGDCTPYRHTFLQRKVGQYCKRNRACEPGMRGCNNLSQRIKLNVQCVNARRIVNQECFRGGNAGHLKAERDAARAANTCRQMWQRNESCRRPRPGNIRRFDG